MKKILTNISISLLTLVLGGCGDFLSEYSQDMVVPKTVDHFNELLIGEVYIQSYGVRDGMSSGSCQFLNMLDDDISTTGTSIQGNVGNPSYQRAVDGMFGYYAWQRDVRYNFAKTNKTEDNATWNDLYHRINVVNIMLNEIEDVPHETDDDYATYLRVKGECHFFRAQAFLILANLYGDAYEPSTCESKLCVPLKLTHYVEYYPDADTQFSRASVKDVYDQIVRDLVSADSMLTISPQKEKKRLHRASWEAAALLLSRTYLYMQDWANAEKQAARVMASANFNMSTVQRLQSGNPFLTADNSEIIFSQGPNAIGMLGGLNGRDWSVAAVPSDYCVTRELYNMYDDNDARKACFFNIAYTDSVALYRKYERQVSVNHISDALTLRMAEAHLNYAEACVMQSKDGEANNVLNKIRRQRIVGYTDQNYSGAELAKQIRDERRKELCFEGHRWFDLRRYAVNTIYPYSRDIIHVFNRYSDNLAYVNTVYYKLPAGDPSYTFSIPRVILDADKVSMPDNPRENREPLEVEDDVTGSVVSPVPGM